MSFSFVALLTVLSGLSAVASLPYTRGEGGFVVVVVCAASTLVAGVTWARFGSTARKHAIPFVLYANVATIAVLFSLTPSFTAMPGVGLLAPISLAALLLLGECAFACNVALNVVVAVTFWVLSRSEGVSPWLVSCRLFVILPVLALPTAFLIWHRRVLGIVDRAQRDSATGLLNRLGFDAEAAIFDTTSFAAPMFVAVSVQIRDGRSPDGHRGKVVSPVMVESMGTALMQTLPPHGVIARTTAAELTAGIWVDGRNAATPIVDAIRARLARDEVSSREGVLSWGCEVAELENSGTRPPTKSWTVQRAVAAAETRQRNMTVSEFAFASPVISAADITAVIDSGGPSIVFQPICLASDSSVVGYEALSRFADSAGPEQWFGAAAANGLGGALERCAVENAIAAAADLPRDAFLSVNVSPASLLAKTLLREVLLGASKTRQLVIEITEGAVINVTDEALEAFSQLREAGIVIALDDVGAGYSGLRQLLAIAPDMVKIDAYLTRQLDSDPSRQALARAMVAFCRATGSRCVFEGVETVAELDAIRSCGGELVQGYLLGRPTLQ